MTDLNPISVTPEGLNSLRGLASRYGEVFSFSDAPREASLIASIGVAREVGTVNDEMARFTYDVSNGVLIPRERLRAEVVEFKGQYGVRIWAEGIHSIEVRVVGFRKLLHPDFSFNQDGTIRQAVFFPSAVAKILALEDVEAVIVNEWATNTVFGRFNPRQGYYQTNLWELVNNDCQRFAKLVEQRRIPFIGTHDVIAHLAGVLSSAWSELTADATALKLTLEDYFAGVKVPTIASRIIPYAAGVLLDDLAQPPNFGHKGRRFVLYEMIKAIQKSKIDPSAERVLMHFPSSYEKAILLSREDEIEKIQAEAPWIIEQMEKEILEASVTLRDSKMRLLPGNY